MLTGTRLAVQSVFVPAEQRNKTMCVREYVHVTENERERTREQDGERVEEGWDKRVAEEGGDAIRKQETGRAKREGIRDPTQRKIRKNKWKRERSEK